MTVHHHHIETSYTRGDWTAEFRPEQRMHKMTLVYKKWKAVLMIHKDEDKPSSVFKNRRLSFPFLQCTYLVYMELDHQMHCNIMAYRGSSEELNRFCPNSATQAYFLLLSPEASEAFYSCLYQGFNAYEMASSAKDRDGRRGQKKSREKKKKKSIGKADSEYYSTARLVGPFRWM